MDGGGDHSFEFRGVGLEARRGGNAIGTGNGRVDEAGVGVVSWVGVEGLECIINEGFGVR
jgi:hypothetical protein